MTGEEIVDMKRFLFLLVLFCLACGPKTEKDTSAENAPSTMQTDNTLSKEEIEEGWLLLFDGKSLDGWMSDTGHPSQRPVEENSINPHKSGAYMLVHKQLWENYILSLDFKISLGCNSGIFVKLSSLESTPDRHKVFNAIEIAIDDTVTAGFHDTGAIYDLVKPKRNLMRKVGEWNHAEITVDRNIVFVNLNGEDVTRINLDEFSEPNKRPDGTPHKFDVVYKNHPPKGYIGLQDHGADIWFKNIKLKPLN